MKKGALITTSIILLLVLVSFFVSAQTTSSSGFVNGFGRVWQGVIDFLTIILSPLFGLGTGEALFIKVLFAIIIFIFVWVIVSTLGLLKDKNWAIVLVSLAVSLLATRILGTQQWIETILLPYSALGIAIASLIPLVIYFYFLEKVVITSTMRKIGWVLAAVVFGMLYLMRVKEIAALNDGGFNPAHIYLITAIICLALFFFDKTIQRTMEKIRAENQNQYEEAQDQMSLMDEIHKIKERLRNETLLPSHDNYRVTYKRLLDRAKILNIEERVTGGLPKPQ